MLGLPNNVSGNTSYHMVITNDAYRHLIHTTCNTTNTLGSFELYRKLFEQVEDPLKACCLKPNIHGATLLHATSLMQQIVQCMIQNPVASNMLHGIESRSIFTQQVA